MRGVLRSAFLLVAAAQQPEEEREGEQQQQQQDEAQQGQEQYPCVAGAALDSVVCGSCHTALLHPSSSHGQRVFLRRGTPAGLEGLVEPMHPPAHGKRNA